jgi:hypothetical protein
MGTVPIRKENAYKPHSWAKGIPLWKEGDPLPPKGMALVVLCARDWGLLENNETKSRFWRGPFSTAGHGFVEVIYSDGRHESLSTHKTDSGGLWLCDNDYLKYALDRDVTRLAYMVPSEKADEAKVAVEEFCKTPYNLLTHNCINATKAGADAVGVGEVLQTLGISYEGDEPVLDYSAKILPGSLHNALEKVILKHLTKPRTQAEIEGEINWAMIASDDPIVPSIRSSIEAKMEEKYWRPPSGPTSIPNMQRGNFGGISFSKRAKLQLDLKEIRGAVFDEGTQQLILIGKKGIQLPNMKLEDLAVAIRC